MKAALGTGVSVFAALALVHGATVANAATIKVNPGDSIQAAVDAAAPGDTVQVFPGTYVETHGGPAAVRITKSLKLIAASKKAPVTILWDSNPATEHGILVEPENDGDPDVVGLKIKGFTIEGFPGNGIWLRHVQNFKIMQNESKNNLHNGIFPTLSAKGVVKKNISYGALDSALWVEASTNVRVLKNELYNSPTGLEITVSKDVLAKKNDIHDNSVGIGLYHPNAASLDPLGDDGDWDLVKNHVYNNNFPNPVTGGLVGDLPSGGGVLVLGVDRVNLKKNVIEGNKFFGLAVVSWCLAADCGTDPPIVDEFADNNTYVKNQFSNNAFAPEPFGGLEFFANDITYLQTEDGHPNCLAKNICDGADCGPGAAGISALVPFYVIANRC